jgi:ABC-2 type transport system permease protein
MKLYLRYFSIHLRSQMQYKSSFLMVLAGQFFGAFASFLTVWFLMDRFKVVDHFTVSQILLCFAVITMAFSLAECFFRGFDRFAFMLGNGQFDRIMVRPRNLVFQVLATQIEFSRLGRFLQALVMMIYTLPRCGVDWTADKILTFALMLICGVLEFAGLFVIYASLCFFSTEGLEFMNIFTDGGREFGSYTLSIYGEGVLKFFTYVIPMALWQYYPLLYLTGRSDNSLFIIAPLASVVFLIPCLILWRIGVRHFRSTGS